MLHRGMKSKNQDYRKTSVPNLMLTERSNFNLHNLSLLYYDNADGIPYLLMEMI
jgi:hypothetical protein